MRLIIAAVTAVFAASLAITTPGLAQQQRQQQQQQTTGAGTKPSPLHNSFNNCVELAMKRGYTYSDLHDDRAEVRGFVINCMQGKQQ